MTEYFIPNDIELADVQRVVEVLEEKLKWYKANYPYAKYEISKMETALCVLNDIENDVANMD